MEHSRVPLTGSWHCHLAPVAPLSSESPGKGVTVLFGVIEPASQEKLGCKHTVEVRMNMSGTQGLPGGISAVPHAMIKFSGKLQQPNSTRFANG